MWVSEKVCLNTQDYFDLVCEAIAGGRQSIVLEMYIFREDKLGCDCWKVCVLLPNAV